MIKYVYIAGPYTHPDPCENTHNACLVASEIRAAGFTPYLPHTSLVWHLVDPHPVDYWYEFDLEWLAVCDALVRIPGDSTGADAEVAFAVEHGIPVFYSLDSLRRAALHIVDVPDGPDD